MYAALFDPDKRTVYDRIPAGFQIATLVIMGVFTAAAVVLVEPSPESKYGRPLAGSHANRRLNTGVARPAGPRPTGRLRLTLRRLLSRRSGKVAPMLPPQDELFTGREQELALLLQDAVESFGRLATDPRHAMRRPMLLPQLLRAVNDRNTSNSQLVKIIARDPAFTCPRLRA